MATEVKRHSMAEALGRSGEVSAFLREGDPSVGKQEKPNRHETPKAGELPVEERIAVTVRLPRNLAHALIDASAERRKNRKKNWSQQDIAAEAILEWLKNSSEEVT